jgi:predicted nucleic acid-binding protein
MPCRRWLQPTDWACAALDVALAEQLDAPLPTADARLARAPGLRCPVEVVEP